MTEVIISTVIMVLIIILISSIFLLSQKSIKSANTKAELIQNSRVALDLMSREIRQAKQIVTSLPIDDSNDQTIQHELVFQDGHDISQITYIRYYLSNNQLLKQTTAYYFDSDPDTYVHYNDIDAFGAPTPKSLDDEAAGKIIGEYFDGLNFYGQGNINIDLIMKKNGTQMKVKSLVNPRNI